MTQSFVYTLTLTDDKIIKSLFNKKTKQLLLKTNKILKNILLIEPV